MGHEACDRLLQSFAEVWVEVVAMQLVAGTGGHTAMGQLQLQRRWIGLAAAPAGAVVKELLAAVHARVPLVEAAAEHLLPLSGEGAQRRLP